MKNKNILVGVSGGIAAYKTAELVRRLRDEEASVHVIMTDASTRFITPMTFEALSGNRAYVSLFEEPLAHIKLPADADLMVVAPATADIIGKYALGLADDLLSTSLMAFSGPVVIAPAMNSRMYENPAVGENISKLSARGVSIVGPEKGSLACGEEGRGRMSEVPAIMDAVRAALSPKDLAGERVVVTAGPTREYIDPVRFISNRSSGKMGYALAKAAMYRGASVKLISGPSVLEAPRGVEISRVETAAEMLGAVEAEIKAGASVLIMAAAVADFAPSFRADIKLEKSGMLGLELEKTVDIAAFAASLPNRPFIVGFAAETGGNLDRARRKMNEKRLDMIVFNDVTEPGAGFDVDTNRITLIDRSDEMPLELMSKSEAADAVLRRIIEIKA